MAPLHRPLDASVKEPRRFVGLDPRLLAAGRVLAGVQRRACRRSGRSMMARLICGLGREVA